MSELSDKVRDVHRELQQAIWAVEFLHGCLTDPESHKYEHPEMTLAHLERWRELTKGVQECTAGVGGGHPPGPCPVHFPDGPSTDLEADVIGLEASKEHIQQRLDAWTAWAGGPQPPTLDSDAEAERLVDDKGFVAIGAHTFWDPMRALRLALKTQTTVSTQADETGDRLELTQRQLERALADLSHTRAKMERDSSYAERAKHKLIELQAQVRAHQRKAAEIAEGTSATDRELGTFLREWS